MKWTISSFSANCLVLCSEFRNVQYDLVFENLSIVSEDKFEVYLLANTLRIKTWSPKIDFFSATTLKGFQAQAEKYIRSADMDADDEYKHSRED